MNLTDSIHASIEANAAKKAPGRPVVADSERQKKLAEMQARAEANGGVKRLGRPAVEGSKRQHQIAEYEAKLLAGYVPKRGRPSFESMGLQKAAPKKTVNKSIAQIALEKLNLEREKRAAAADNETVVTLEVVVEAPIVTELKENKTKGKDKNKAIDALLGE